MSVSDLGVQELWSQYSREKWPELKNELVLRYLTQVKSVVTRMMPTYKAYSSYDDMLSYGILGLMDAVEKYDVSRGVKFEYYAAMRIKGEIIDNIRKQDWAPSSLRRKIKAINNAYSELGRRLCREPADSEVARYLDMSEEDLQSTLGKSHMFDVIYLEELVQSDDAWEYAIYNDDSTLEEEVERRETVEILGGFIDNLPEMGCPQSLYQVQS